MSEPKVKPGEPGDSQSAPPGNRSFGPANRREEMFPKLSDAQIARLRPHGRERHFGHGDLLFEQGQNAVPFYVILEGKLSVVHPPSNPKPGAPDEVIVLHEAKEFTGELALLSGRRSLVVGRAEGDLRVLELGPREFRELIQNDAELSELFMRAFILRRSALISNHLGEVVIVGSRHSAATLRLQEFLTRNSQPFDYQDVERDPGAQELLDGFHLSVDDIPVLVCRGSPVLKNPSNAQVAECLELNIAIDERAVRDVIVIGAGPAGLAAAVYAGSEGLSVLVVETNAPGGQAGSSSKIENYLGFPEGISGQDLAGRAFTQAEKFGAEITIARSAQKLLCERRPYRLEVADGVAVSGRAVIIATGAEYRKPEIPELVKFEGAGIYYGASHLEAQRCEGEELIIVGGGNSAGQAAVFLARTAAQVTMMVRGAALAESMSRYLVRRIEETPNIRLLTRTQIESLGGADHLERVTWVEANGERQTRDIRHVFMMTGAKPNTDWLRRCVTLDEKGFVKTGVDLTPDDLLAAKWPLARRPYLMETSLPGIFAVGDVRSESVKRVAAAVGDGSTCVQLVHRVLGEGN